MVTEKPKQNLNVAAKSGQTWKFFGKLIGGIILLVILMSLIYRGYSHFHKQTTITEATASTGQMSTVLQPSQRILKLVPGGSIQWVSIPRGMCSEANPAQGCVNWFINDESTPVQLCRGIPVNVPGPSFRIGFSADQKTTVAVDLFPCN